MGRKPTRNFSYFGADKINYTIRDKYAIYLSCPNQTHGFFKRYLGLFLVLTMAFAQFASVSAGQINFSMNNKRITPRVP